MLIIKERTLKQRSKKHRLLREFIAVPFVVVIVVYAIAYSMKAGVVVKEQAVIANRQVQSFISTFGCTLIATEPPAIWKSRDDLLVETHIGESLHCAEELKNDTAP